MQREAEELVDLLLVQDAVGAARGRGILVDPSSIMVAHSAAMPLSFAAPCSARAAPHSSASSLARGAVSLR